jgi:dephospho-CoA kinase
MLNVGLTGGVASGKSTVARMLAEKGAYHIDFDELAHAVVKPDQSAWRQIIDDFGSDFVNPDRTINRSRLAAIVFRDKKKRAELNSIVHPAIFAAWCCRTQEIKEIHPEAIIVSDAPLLIEEGMQPLFDLVMLVYIPQEEQLTRLMRRSDLRREDAQLRLASQMPIEAKLPFAQIVIDNRGTLEETRRRVDQVWQDLLKREKETININHGG